MSLALEPKWGSLADEWSNQYKVTSMVHWMVVPITAAVSYLLLGIGE
jgi:hypothetical protein